MNERKPAAASCHSIVASFVVRRRLSGTSKERVAESADLLYHLCVLWVAAGVDPNEVFAELTAREGRSGLDDKAARKGIVR